jgi:hypothetical protein
MCTGLGVFDPHLPLEHRCCSNAGIRRNIGRDGRINQKVASTCAAAMFAMSGLSRQSQIMPSTETNGSEAMSPPTPGYFLGDFRDDGDEDARKSGFDGEVPHGITMPRRP